MFCAFSERRRDALMAATHHTEIESLRRESEEQHVSFLVLHNSGQCARNLIRPLRPNCYRALSSFSKLSSTPTSMQVRAMLNFQIPCSITCCPCTVVGEQSAHLPEKAAAFAQSQLETDV